jgi:hypothetical protein
MTTTTDVYRAMSEADWQRSVIDVAMRLGWRCHFLPDGVWTALYERYKRRGRPSGIDLASSGFPDLVLCHAESGRLIFAELKSQSGKVRPTQQEWLDDLAACGISVYVWRPSAMDDVIAVLSQESTP